MKRSLIATTILSAALAASAVPAFASDAYDSGSMLGWVPQTSALSRADVENGIVQARAQGLLEQTDTVYPKIAAVDAPKTRAQVEQDLANSGRLQGKIYQNP